MKTNVVSSELTGEPFTQTLPSGGPNRWLCSLATPSVRHGQEFPRLHPISPHIPTTADPSTVTRGMERQPPQPPGLLDLPAHIRHRIYLHLGIAHPEGYPYTYCLDGRKATLGRGPFQSYYAPPSRNFTGLLRSCRALYNETAALLYSANRFIIYYYTLPHPVQQENVPVAYPGSLKPLHALSPTALASLTSLKIVLNECSCHHLAVSAEYPPRCCGERSEYGIWDSPRRCTESHSPQHCQPLLSPARGGFGLTARLSIHAMTSEWHNAAAYLSPHINPGRLELSLVCDIDPKHSHAVEVGLPAVAPIALFPRLKDIQIRLSHIPSNPLRLVAQEAVCKTHIRGASPYLHPGRARESATLMTLPAELRIRILEHTDLITPWKEVTWSREQPKYQVCRPPCRLPREDACPPDIHHGCLSNRCHVGDKNPAITGGGPPPGQGCFCSHRHAASSFSCRCWAPPTDLFLVCRALCLEAQFVFFSGNRFVVHDYCATPPWKLPPEQHIPRDLASVSFRYPFDRFAASLFLRDVVPAHCLAHLRFLEVVFPPYVPHCWPNNKHPALRDWRETVTDWLTDKISAPALTARVVMADFYSMVHGRLFVTDKEGNDIIKAYRRITCPLRQLGGAGDGGGGLAGCYVQPAYPWKHTAQVRQLLREAGRWWLAEAEKALKEDLERGMREGGGEEGPAGGAGRPEPGRSVWQRSYDIPVWSM